MVYCIVVWLANNTTRQGGRPVGPGRRVAALSLVCHGCDAHVKTHL